MELSNTAYAILGLLHEGPRSGYDIKQAADRSVRYFWAVGYGQIYPELKKLAKAGLVEREEISRGARDRQPYRLTTEGRKALMAWIETGIPAPIEIRDEMLLKLFFSDSVSAESRLALLRLMRARHEATAATLRSYRTRGQVTHPMHTDVLEYGIGLHTWCAEWCERVESKLTGRNV